MLRTQKIAIASLLLFAALVALMFLRNRQPPALPADEFHRWEGAATCMECHDANGALPRSVNHPVGQDCVRCHGVAG